MDIQSREVAARRKAQALQNLENQRKELDSVIQENRKRSNLTKEFILESEAKDAEAKNRLNKRKLDLLKMEEELEQRAASHSEANISLVLREQKAKQEHEALLASLKEQKAKAKKEKGRQKEKEKKREKERERERETTRQRRSFALFNI